MKKLMRIMVLCLALMTLAGCSSEKQTIMECTKTTNITSSAKLDAKYVVTIEGDYITKINSVEKVTSDDKTYLEAYKESIENVYKPYQDIEYYNSKVVLEENTVTSTIDADYSKIDIDKLIKIDSSTASLFENGKITKETMKSVYESLGATCKNK